MRRTGFKRKTIERVRTVHTPGTGRGVHAMAGDEVVAVPKDAPIRSEPYRRLVASLPCDRCKVAGYTQVCHADEGKGAGIKSSDLTCYPGCGPRYKAPGCHYMIGSTGMLTKEGRRQYEAEAGARTRLKLLVMAQDDAKVAKVLRDVGLLP